MFKTKYYLPTNEIKLAYKNEETIHTFTYENNYDIYENAVLLPLIVNKDPLISNGRPVICGGVSDEKFNFLAGYYYKENGAGNEFIEYTRSYIPDHIEESSETVIFSGDLHNHFGHFLVDSMVRMWYAIKYDNTTKIALLLNARWDWSEWDLDGSYQLKMLKYLGIEKDRILIVKKPTKFKSVIVPRQSVFWYENRYDPELLRIVYDKARVSICSSYTTGYKKIYLSRSRWKTPILNETYFEKFFAAQGFKILHTQELPLEDQISYIACADEIVCTYGSLSHMALFATSKAKLICLLRSGFPKPNRQIIISQLNHIDTVYIDTSISYMNSGHTEKNHLLVPTAQWREFLKHEYNIDIDIDIYRYLNKSGIMFGDYLSVFIDEWKSFYRKFGVKFNTLTYLSQLLKKLDPDLADKMLHQVKINDNQLFRDRLFIYKLYKNNIKCVVLLLANGSIWPVDERIPNLGNFWLYKNNRLYFLDGNYNIISEFVIEHVSGAMWHTKFYGVIQSKVTDTCSLKTYLPGLVRNWVIRHTIKYLVSKKKYKILKKRPDMFFKHCKSSLIRFLGRYYIRGNSTVIFYWRKAFKEYFDTHDMQRKVDVLKEGMDEISIKYIDNFMRLSRYWYDSSCVGSQWTEHDLKKQRECKRFAKTLVQPFPDILKIKPYFFYDIYGLADLPAEALSSIEGKIIIDGGG